MGSFETNNNVMYRLSTIEEMKTLPVLTDFYLTSVEVVWTCFSILLSILHCGLPLKESLMVW